MRPGRFAVMLVMLAGGLAGGVALTRFGIVDRVMPGLEESGPPAGGGETALAHAEKHLDPNYVCPMHPQIVRQQPGSCPICGMDLVLLEQEEQRVGGEREVLYYRHPHDPGITSEQPMQDELGMEYLPVYADERAAVTIAPEVVNNLGVRTAQVERSRLWRRIDTVGYVDYNQSHLIHVHLRADGWIDRLYIASSGERVTQGQRLFDVYSPKLVNAQDEYLQARASGNQNLVRASRERLLALGVAESQIDEMLRRGRALQVVTYYAPADGVVATLNAPQGMYVKPEMEVMSIADLASVWVYAEVFEQQANWVAVGQPAEVRLAYQPEQTWEGEVEYVYPDLAPQTRTLRVRLRFPNPDEQLKPNMYADVTIFGGAREDIVVVPREALIRTGRGERVILALGGGRFVPRRVVSGMESGDFVEIAAGLEPGQTVVVSGQFLIDSEASLKASLRRMQSPEAGDAAAAGGVTSNPNWITGTGVLRRLLPDQSKVNIEHAPIEALGWPAMTMDFELAPEVSLDSLAPGDAVEFELSEQADGFRIRGLRRRAPEEISR